MLTNLIVDDKETWEVNRANMLRKSSNPLPVILVRARTSIVLKEKKKKLKNCEKNWVLLQLLLYAIIFFKKRTFRYTLITA